MCTARPCRLHSPAHGTFPIARARHSCARRGYQRRCCGHLGGKQGLGGEVVQVQGAALLCFIFFLLL